MAVAPLLIMAGGMVAQAGLSYLMRPKLPPVEKGKYDDIRITLSTFGTYIPRGWGMFRISGIIDFSTGVQHFVVETPSSGGKGAPSAPATRTHVYQTTLGIIVCRGEIDRISRIWTDADLLTGSGTTGVPTTGSLEAEDATLAGGATSYADGTASGGEAVQNIGNGGTVEFFIPGAPPPPPEQNYVPRTRISFYYKTTTTKQATLTLTSDADVIVQTVDFLGGTGWQVQTIHVDDHIGLINIANASAPAPDLDKITYQWYWMRDLTRTEPFYDITGNVHPNIDYPKDLNDPSEFYNYEPAKDAGTGEISLTPLPAFGLTIYTGTETQTQDAAEVAWLESRFGTGQGVLYANAHRGLARVVLTNYTLKQGRVQNFTFEVKQADEASVQEIAEDLMSDVGLTSDDWNTSALTGLTAHGFLEHQQTSRNALLDQLQRYFHFRRCEIDGKIKFISENAPSLHTIEANELRAHSDTEEIPVSDAEVLMKEEQLLPLEVRFSVMNPQLDYRNESVPSTPLFGSPCTEPAEYNFAIIDTPENAKERAEIQLLKEHVEDKGIEYWGMPSLQKYTPGDVLTINLKGVPTKHRIERKRMQLPVGKIQFIGVPSEQAIFNNAVKKTNDVANRDEPLRAYVNFPRNSVIFPITTLPIREADVGRLGVYLAISGRGRGNWENCAVYREYDEDNYVFQFIVDSPSPLGICRTALAAHPSNPDVSTEDTTSELIIDFFDDIELETLPQDELDRYPTANLIRIGNEWIQFRTATAEVLPDNSPYRSSWKIENLWRGKFETDSANAVHDADEYAAVVTPALRFFELEGEDIGEVVNLKAVTNGQSVEVAPVSSFTFEPLSRYDLIGFTTENRDVDATASGTLRETMKNLHTLIKDTRF